MFALQTVLIVFLAGPWQSAVVSDRSPELDLVRWLIRRGGNKLSKPSSIKSENVTFVVKTRLYLIRIQKIEEHEQTFHSIIRLQLTWKNRNLAWNPSEFGSLEEAVVPGGKLWVPPLHIANAVEGSSHIWHLNSRFPFRVHRNGKVWYHPTGKSSTQCQFDLTYYPFDYQRCLIIVESEVYQEMELKIVTREDDIPGAVSFGMFSENEIWELVRNQTFAVPKVYKSGKRTSFSRVHFVITVRRKPGFFVITVVIPAVILAIITLLIYFVPVHYVDRPVQAVTTVLAVAIFQSTVAEKMPSNSESCLLTSYLTVVMCSSAITVLTTTICLAIVDPGEYIKAPWGIPNIANALSPRWKSILACLHLFRPKANCKNEPELPSGDFIDKQMVCSEKSATLDSENGHTNENGYLPKSQPVSPTKHVQLIVSQSSASLANRRGGLVAINEAPRILKTIEKYEAGHKLLSAKQAWYKAYTINWIGFAICVIATSTIPIVAFVNKDSADARFFRKYVINDEQYLKGDYYGDL